jgi:hypothetical protein
MGRDARLVDNSQSDGPLVQRTSVHYNTYMYHGDGETTAKSDDIAALESAVALFRVRPPAGGPLAQLRDRMLRLPSLIDALKLEVQGTSPQSFLRGEYRRADEGAAVSERGPFSVDPTKIERALKSHAATQNALAAHLTTLGLNPRSPLRAEPNYDIAWETTSDLYIGEVKSLPLDQEENQLRIGLGQVLRYRQKLRDRHPERKIVAALIPEHEPLDKSWDRLCSELGVLLAWPGAFDRLGLGPHRADKHPPESKATTIEHQPARVGAS